MRHQHLVDEERSLCHVYCPANEVYSPYQRSFPTVLMGLEVLSYGYCGRRFFDGCRTLAMSLALHHMRFRVDSSQAPLLWDHWSTSAFVLPAFEARQM